MLSIFSTKPTSVDAITRLSNLRGPAALLYSCLSLVWALCPSPPESKMIFSTQGTTIFFGLCTKAEQELAGRKSVLDFSDYIKSC